MLLVKKYVHPHLYVYNREDRREIMHLKGAEITEKDLFARMAQSIIDTKNYGQSTLPEKGLP